LPLHKQTDLIKHLPCDSKDNIHDVSRDVVIDFITSYRLRDHTVTDGPRVGDSTLKDHASVFTTFIVLGLTMNQKR
jgi:hypothetical protein